jgi:hypothetical protein
MMKRLLFTSMLMASTPAWSDTQYPGLQVEVTRAGNLYTFIASFDIPLTQCAAYRYLTDYDAAKSLPGVIESLASRESANTVKVERTADERVMFFHIRLHSIMEYTEKPYNGVDFTQLSGDSKVFQGSWSIQPNPQGSTLRFRGLWEPDTLIPLFIIDHFAKNGLVDRFSAIAELAGKRKDVLSNQCGKQQLARSAE